MSACLQVLTDPAGPLSLHHQQSSRSPQSTLPSSSPEVGGRQDAVGINSMPGTSTVGIGPQQVQQKYSEQPVSHDLDANAQWLEVLAPSSSLPSSPSPDVATISSPLTMTTASAAASQGAAASSRRAGQPPSKVGRGMQRSALHDSHHHQPRSMNAAVQQAYDGSSTAGEDLLPEASRVWQRHRDSAPSEGVASPQASHRHTPLRTRVLVRSCSPKPEIYTEHDSSSSESIGLKKSTHRPRSRVRGTGKQHFQLQVLGRRLYQLKGQSQQGSSDESDQMTFAEAAGIRRRPDDLSWPAYRALQEGRQVQLLDRNSPVPPRSTAKARQHSASSQEARSARRVLHLHEGSSLLLDPPNAEGHSRGRTGRRLDSLPGTTSRISGERRNRRIRHVVSSEKDPSSMLDRLLTAWQEGSHGSGHGEPCGMQDRSNFQPDSRPNSASQHNIKQAEGCLSGAKEMLLLSQQAVHSTDEACSRQDPILQEISCLNDDRFHAELQHPHQQAGAMSHAVTDESRHGSPCEQADAAQLDLHQADELDDARDASTASAAAADGLLAGFWDTWQQAAQDTCNAGDLGHNLHSQAVDIPLHHHAMLKPSPCQPSESLQSPAIEIPTRHHRQQSSDTQQKHSKHAVRRNAHRHSDASEQLHWRQRKERHHGMPSRTLKHPAAAAAASRLVNEAATDPIDALLQMYPGLDPVVADLILQVRLDDLAASPWK